MEIGISKKEILQVDDSVTAKTVGSGTLDVLATPAMCALIEKAAMNAVAPFLENGQATVGSSLEVKHISATPIGIEVYAIATLKEIDGRRLVFDVAAYDNAGEIGKGTHERFIINTEKFMNKASQKLA